MNNTVHLSGMRVLLVEDESLVSMLAEDILAEAGCEVVLAMRLEEGLHLAASERFDLAVLDINLGGGQTSYPIARLLMDRAIPFAFASGYGHQALSTDLQKHPMVQKPYTPATLLDGVARALSARCN